MILSSIKMFLIFNDIQSISSVGRLPSYLNEEVNSQYVSDFIFGGLPLAFLQISLLP